MTRIIDLKTIWAGPEGVKQPGQHEVSKKAAFGLCQSLQAEYADGLPPEIAIAAPVQQVAVVKPPEVAKAAPAASKAVQAQAPVVAPVEEVKINLQTPPAWGAPK